MNKFYHLKKINVCSQFVVNKHPKKQQNIRCLFCFHEKYKVSILPEKNFITLEHVLLINSSFIFK